MARIGLSAKRQNLPHGARIESLETRQLLAVTGVASLPDVLGSTTNPASNTVNLATYLSDTNVPGTIADITFYSAQPIFAKHTHSATVQVALTNNATPVTVANFLSYATSGAYNGTFLHRAVDIASGSGGSPTDPATIVQGGGYYVNQSNPFAPTVAQIKTNAAIINEAATETYGNIAGTISMARTTDVNSATSQWFFNVSDNTDLDESSSNSDSSNTLGYAVFGKVLGDGLTTLTTLSKLATGTLNSKLGLTTVPLAGVSAKDAAIAKAPLSPRDLVYIKDVTTQTGVTYTATSSNPSLVTPVVNGTQLSFRYGAAGGVASITVTANDGYDGSTATQTFHVTVPAAGATSTGPVTAADSATAASGATTTLDPAGNDYDTASPLDTSTLTITTPPAHGIATVDAAAGNITYTPTAGFTGTDTLVYNIGDYAGNSASATITVNVVAAPVTVSIGSASAKALRYTEPDGSVSTVRVSGGTAVVTFAGPGVTTSTAGGTVVASGADATIEGIVITNATKQQATLNISASKGTDTVGVISDTGAMTAIVAPGTTLVGPVTVGGNLGLLRVGSTNNASFSLGGTAADSTVVDLPTAINTSISSTSTIAALRSASWTTTGTGNYTVAAPDVKSLAVRNAFADGLAVTGGVLRRATVGGKATGSWTVTGNVSSATVGSVATGWAATVTGTLSSLNIRSGGLSGALIAGGINSLNVKGDVSGPLTSTASINAVNIRGSLTGGVTANSIKTLAVTGSLSGSTITTTGATTTAVATQLNRLQVGGAISGETINIAGSVGTVSAASMSSSSLLAGILSTTAAAGTLPTASTDFAADAIIRSVHLRSSAAATFSNSKIAAETLLHTSLGTIQNSNGGVAEGLAAEHLRTVTGKLSAGGVLTLSRRPLASAATLSSYLTKKKITLSDFAINIVAASSS